VGKNIGASAIGNDMTQNHYDVFISFNSVDREWARRLARKLSRTGYLNRKFKVFFDEWEIGVGESIPKAIGWALEHTTRVIAILTPEWLESEWCQLESETTVYSDPAGARKTLVPLLLRECQLPSTLRRLRWLDFRDEKQFDRNYLKLVSELRKVNREDIISSLLNDQKHSLLNQSILPWSPERSPSLDFIWPDLNVDPLVRAQKHPGRPLRFGAWSKAFKSYANVAVVGKPGIGKSTVLRILALEASSRPFTDKNFNSSIIPLLVTARELIELAGRHPDSPDLLLSHIAKLPLELVGQIKILFLVDGVDEIGEQNIEALSSALRLILSLSEAKVWIACRDDFFFQNIGRDAAWSALFFEIIELLEWDERKDSWPFIRKYAKKMEQLFLVDRLRDLLKDHQEARAFLLNPFHLTLLLYILSGKESFSTQQKFNAYSLYQLFYDNWLSREHHRGTTQCSPDIVRKGHMALASALYVERTTGVDLAGTINSVIKEREESRLLLSDSSFSDLLIKRMSPVDSILVARFWHETFAEFLLAEQLVEAFREGGALLCARLEIIYNYEVNSFVRCAFELMPSIQREEVLSNLERLYLSRLSRSSSIDSVLVRNGYDDRIAILSESSGPKDERIREQVLYYIGRLPTADFPSILRVAYEAEPKSLLRRAAALSAILHGDLAVEAEYIGKLKPGSPEDIENRSVQLVYFGDSEGDIHSYRDEGRIGWNRVRAAIYQRISLASRREIQLRWWDLRTLFLFYESRGWKDEVTSEEVEILRSLKIDAEEPSMRRDALEAELNALLTRLRLGENRPKRIDQ
jgi:hypothetical protein